MNTLTKAAQRAANSLADAVMTQTIVGYGPERPDVLDAVARLLLKRSSELRQQQADRQKEAIR